MKDNLWENITQEPLEREVPSVAQAQRALNWAVDQGVDAKEARIDLRAAFAARRDLAESPQGESDKCRVVRSTRGMS